MSTTNIKQQIFNTTLALYKVTERIPADEPLRNRLRERGIELMMLVQDIFSGKMLNSDTHAILRQEFDNLGFLLEFGRFYTSINPANFSILIQSYQSLWQNIDNFIKVSLESSPEESLQKLLSEIKDPTDNSLTEIQTEASPEAMFTGSGSKDDGLMGKNNDLKNYLQKNKPKSVGAKGINTQKQYSASIKRPSFQENSAHNKNFSGKQVLRQQKIINILEEKSLNEFQLKDILGEFPNFNEKTVRNDLKVLCASGVLQRNGVGRSSSYKVIRQTPNN